MSARATVAEPLEEQEFLSERNLARLRAAYEAMGRDGLDSVEAWDLISDDIVIRDRPEAPDPQTYKGREGARKALAASDETFEEFTMEPVDLIAVGDAHVVVVLRMFGRGRGSGVPVEEEIAHLWTVDNGKAVAMQVYSDPQDALRDARASAPETTE
jgi:ketosteroid isomerase-like protein